MGGPYSFLNKSDTEVLLETRTTQAYRRPMNFFITVTVTVSSGSEEQSIAHDMCCIFNRIYHRIIK